MLPEVAWARHTFELGLILCVQKPFTVGRLFIYLLFFMMPTFGCTLLVFGLQISFPYVALRGLVLCDLELREVSLTPPSFQVLAINAITCNLKVLFVFVCSFVCLTS